MGDPFFSHPLALVESDDVGDGTRVWAWAHVMQGARVGAQCNIGEHCFIESGAVLGDRVTVKNGVSVWDGVRTEDDVFLGPHAVLTNDMRPRSRTPGFVPRPTLLERGCSVGANATILCGLTLGRYCLVGAGAVVTHDVAAYTVVRGNPARPRGHVCACARPLRFDDGTATCECGMSFHMADGIVGPADDRRPG